MLHIDPSAIEVFVMVADMQSFTRTADALGTSQSAISLKIQRLETRLERRLLERTPRSVTLTADGATFIKPARKLLQAYKEASYAFEVPAVRLRLGISHHLIGPDLPSILRAVREADTNCLFEIRIGTSNELQEHTAAGDLDAMVLLGLEGRTLEGDLLGKEVLGWYGALDFQFGGQTPIPLATQSAPCGLRALSIHALERAGVAWREVFVGGGATVLGSAIAAGLCVGVLAKRTAISGIEDITDRLSLPALTPCDCILVRRTTDQAHARALKTFAAAFRSGR